jgi:uncharacterized protein (TIGR03435 family)
MLQNLSNEPFQLRVRRETKSFRVYHLVAAKNGPKLKRQRICRRSQTNRRGDGGVC